ncbi:LCP family protein [Sporosarcina saromensis]|uniref:Regulatory protein MsrR n=1 Tax=Sporosarcina saromensis TaxID=359365 RepID=A0ABU4G516_9BACL|nr:LCP family protein [Sporosarcina saromensis]MDW0112069.1 LCP family protein [Sporosarcina saromensis]
MHLSRQEIRKTKKRKKLGIIIGIVVLLLGAGVFYWVTQYNQGLALSDDGTLKEQNEDYGIFDGPEPKFGEINILLLGSDARKDEDGRSDTLMIANYNQETKKMKLVSIMRDTYVDIPGHGMHKMNSAFTLGGPELVRQTIKENFGLDAHYYAMVDFKGFPKIVDILAPDGIEVDIPYTMSHGIYMTLNPGVQTLHGDQLLGYVRFRHDSQNDFGRVARQQEVISKLKDEAVSVHSLTKLPKLLGAADAYIDTNLDKMKMLSIGKGMLDNKAEKIETLRIPVDKSFTERRVNVGEVLELDFDKNIEALNAFLDDKNDLADTEEPKVD